VDPDPQHWDQGTLLNPDAGFAESGSKRLCWQFTNYLHYITFTLHHFSKIKSQKVYHRERILETSTLSCNEEEEEITKPPKR
jgi:hypothetical protein